MFKRYVRAFFIALKMTLRGEKPPAPSYPVLRQWMSETDKLTTMTFAAADSAGMDKAAREKIQMRFEGRTQTMETILAAIRYHVREEYPYMLRHETEHNFTAIFASNLNDRFALSKLIASELVTDTKVKNALTILSAHLERIPPTVDAAQGKSG